MCGIDFALQWSHSPAHRDFANQEHCMNAVRTLSTPRDTYEAPALVYTREAMHFKPKARTWSAPGPMASVQHAERKELVAAAADFEDDEFQACWWPGESWDWE